MRFWRLRTPDLTELWGRSHWFPDLRKQFAVKQMHLPVKMVIFPKSGSEVFLESFLGGPPV